VKNGFGGYVACMAVKRGVYTLSVVKSGEWKSIIRPRRRRDDNIKIDLEEKGWGVQWIGLSQDRDVWRDFF
jgi:hypothetical protein